MPADFDALFAAMTRDANDRPLAEPRALRRAGDHRARVRQLAAAAGAVLAVVLAGAVALVMTSSPKALPAQPAPSPTLAQIAPPPSSATDSPSPSAPPSSPAARAAGADCRPADLDPRPWYAVDAGAGQVFSVVMVQNRSAMPCQLRGNPTLLVTDAAGHLTPFPYNSPCPTCSGVTVAPGGYARFGIGTRNNPDPSGPGCTGPNGLFQGFVVDFGNGSRYPLPDFGLRLNCGQATLYGWSDSDDPAVFDPNVRRAPMPTGTPSP